ncbi:unnamed protein product [Lasius platythorax]|uniref:Uncharacterized protein n=1 Tax=Lasius platythorax TaxID=488582 RepID=A0AAV2N1K3_9HYME
MSWEPHNPFLPQRLRRALRDVSRGKACFITYRFFVVPSSATRISTNTNVSKQYRANRVSGPHHQEPEIQDI